MKQRRSAVREPPEVVMPFHITIPEDAEAQMKALPVREQRVLQAAILARLQDRPTTPTRAIKAAAESSGRI